MNKVFISFDVLKKQQKPENGSQLLVICTNPIQKECSFYKISISEETEFSELVRTIVMCYIIYDTYIVLGSRVTPYILNKSISHFTKEMPGKVMIDHSHDNLSMLISDCVINEFSGKEHTDALTAKFIYNILYK